MPPNGRQPNGNTNSNGNGGGNGKPPKKKRKKTALWVTLAVIAAILLIAGSIYGYYISRYNRDVRVDQEFADGWDDLDTEGSGPASLQDIEGNSDPIIRVKQKDKNIENILLLGVDGGDMGDAGHRSDSMMIVSINKKDNTIKITSLMRDIWAYYPTRDKYDKLNAAYSYGGPGQSVNIVNHNFDMDIQKFVVTDFNGLINLVDVLGGIKIDISSAEATQIPGITPGEKVTLSGAQALAYARIRKIDSDFSRVERQRNVIMAMLSTMRSEDPQTQVNTVNESMQYVRSNISGGELTGDLMNMVLSVSSGIDQKTIPEEGMYTVNASGSWYMELDWERQIESLHEFIFGK
ncbi:MAG: LCP family protein [Clostridiaceae bacterium]|nr:LCP family protein [Clostridiaceae bacterium]